MYEDNINMYVKGIEFGGHELLSVGPGYVPLAVSCKDGNEPPGFLKEREIS
jgi:hypothetical protein